MILRWLRKKILSTKDPERVLLFCAAFGAVENLGVMGAGFLVWNVIKKRKRQKKGKSHAKNQKGS
jgi:hypothetical protein